MKIEPPCVVALTWSLSDTRDDVLDVLAQPREFFVGGHDLLQVIEQALLNASAGDKVQLQIEPEQGFGEFDAQLIFLEARRLFTQPLAVGMTLAAATLPVGCHAKAHPAARYTVTDIYPEHVVLDGNHPLAGMALRLRLHVHAVRNASAEEVAQGCAGGPLLQILSQHAQAPGNNTLH